MRLRLIRPLLLLFLSLVLLFALMLFTAGCAPATQDLSDDGKGDFPGREGEIGSGAAVKVITTIFPLEDIAGNLGGERARVTGLLPPGASPHTYEPTVEQAKAVAGADLFIFMGGGVDNWVIGLAEAANIPALDITASMEKDLLDYHGTFDPHVWVDPVLVKDIIAPLIAEKLKAADPEGMAYYDQALEGYQDRLEELHKEIVATTAGFSKNGFISYHSAWNYFARRYGLEEIAAVEPFPGQEPSAGWLARLARLAGEHQINVLFAEPQLSPKAAQIIAEEIKGRVLLLDPLGGKGVPGRESYTDLMRYNLEIFKMALE